MTLTVGKKELCSRRPRIWASILGTSAHLSTTRHYRVCDVARGCEDQQGRKELSQLHVISGERHSDVTAYRQRAPTLGLLVECS